MFYHWDTTRVPRFYYWHSTLVIEISSGYNSLRLLNISPERASVYTRIGSIYLVNTRHGPAAYSSKTIRTNRTHAAYLHSPTSDVYFHRIHSEQSERSVRMQLRVRFVDGFSANR